MAGNALVVEPAIVLAPPSQHSAEQDFPEEIIDLDGGAIDGNRPDDGKDISQEEAPEDKAETQEEPEAKAAEEATEEDAEEAELAALAAEPAKPEKLSGSARLKAKLAEALAENERLRQVVPKVDEKAALASAIEQEIGPPPKESDFPDYLQFSKAETAYETAKILVARDMKRAAESVKNQAELQNQAIVETFQERAASVRQQVKDFDAVLGSATASPTHRDTIMTILESEKGPQISYYLAKHPEKVAELNALPVHRQLAEIGRLEARLTRPEPRKESKAPPPVPPLKSSERIKEVDPEKLPMDQFAQWFDAKKKAYKG